MTYYPCSDMRNEMGRVMPLAVEYSNAFGNRSYRKHSVIGSVDTAPPLPHCGLCQSHVCSVMGTRIAACGMGKAGKAVKAGAAPAQTVPAIPTTPHQYGCGYCCGCYGFLTGTYS